MKAVLEKPSPSAKYARWWSKVYASGVRSVQIIYRPGKENSSADALSRNPQGEPPTDSSQSNVHVAAVNSTTPIDSDISQLLQQECTPCHDVAGTDLGPTRGSKNK